MKLSVEITGSANVKDALMRLGSRAPQSMGRALWNEGTRIMNEAKELVPVRTSALKTSGLVNLPVIDGSKVDVQMGFGGAASAYAAFVHEGTRPHVISASNAAALHFIWHGRDVFFASVQHPGTKPTKFLEIPLKAAQFGMNQRLFTDLWDDLSHGA